MVEGGMTGSCRSLVIIGWVVVLFCIAILSLECLCVRHVHPYFIDLVLFNFLKDGCSINRSVFVTYWLLLVYYAHLAHLGLESISGLGEGWYARGFYSFILVGIGVTGSPLFIRRIKLLIQVAIQYRVEWFLGRLSSFLGFTNFKSCSLAGKVELCRLLLIHSYGINWVVNFILLIAISITYVVLIVPRVMRINAY